MTLSLISKNSTPVYKVIDEDGPDHNKTFKVGVYVEHQLKATGSGHSKQEAEAAAAAEAVKGYLKLERATEAKSAASQK